MSTKKTSYTKRQVGELEILAQAVNILSSTLVSELEKRQIDTQLALDIAKSLKVISEDMRNRLHWLYETLDLDLDLLIEEARKELQKQIQQ
jgi:DNA-directed RNA polymerase delta subunit